MNEHEEKKRRTDIIAAMHLIPLHVDFNEGCAMLRILYDIGWLRGYFFQSRNRERNPDPESRTESLLCEDCEYGFTFENNVRTDSFGRITSLEVPAIVDRDDEDEIQLSNGYYDLPPSISLLRHLEYILIQNCQRIPLEIGDLPCLTKIYFGDDCDSNLFNRIPEGCQLSYAKRVSCWCSPSSISSFLGLLPNGLEELNLNCKETSNAIISAFQSRGLRFHQSLTKLDLACNQVDNVGFESLLFKVVPRFPKLRELHVGCNNITSLPSVNEFEKEIQKVRSNFNTKLVKLDLGNNPVILRGIIVSSELKSSKMYSIEKSAALMLLKTFGTISNLGASLSDQYEPDIECVLRTNLMDRLFTDGGIAGKWPSNPALWPLMLEKVYQKSWKIYENSDGSRLYSGHGRNEIGAYSEKYKKKKRCATELFHMVRNGPIFAVDRPEISQETSTMEDDTRTT